MRIVMKKLFIWALSCCGQSPDRVALWRGEDTEHSPYTVTMKKFVWIFLLFSLVTLLLTQPAMAQTDPEGTPANGYPPPATPAQLEEAYPAQLSPPDTTTTNEAYIAPTTAVLTTTGPTAVIGDAAPAATAVTTLPISQSTIVRNRAILWAGFLLTLLIFLLAVYGAMLMYTRPRN
jgi:hypothetical protein